ncbi:MurR/RpiR family transcriptional regulator [Halomonas sp.]|uniref:MurR/RpiR family transcriptional regulator n=1 Tax=Halomonas sp. TaxID=1486246 RepID=UPI00384E24CF
MTSSHDTQSLEARIHVHYTALPPAEKRLGDLLLSFPGDIATYSAGELADAAGTSRAAASRFFQRLGYKDFNEARQQAREAKRWGSPVYLASASSPGGKTSSGLASQPIADHLAQESLNLTRTLEAIRPDHLRDAVDAIANATRVHVAGFRNSHMLAGYLQRQLQIVRADVALLPKSGQTLAEDLVDIAEGDVLIMVGMRRRVHIASRILEIARQQGARTLLLTDTSLADPIRQATWTLTCEVRSQSLFDSYSASMSVINLLCTSLFHHEINRGQERLKRIETLHDELDELDAISWLSQRNLGNKSTD